MADDSAGGGSWCGFTRTVDDRRHLVDAAGRQPLRRDLEYDNDFREMDKAAAGRPPTQFEIAASSPTGVPSSARTQSCSNGPAICASPSTGPEPASGSTALALPGACGSSTACSTVLGRRASAARGRRPLRARQRAERHVQPCGLLGDLRESRSLATASSANCAAGDIEVALGALEPRSGETVYSRQADRADAARRRRIGRRRCAIRPRAAGAGRPSCSELRDRRLGGGSRPAAAA